MSIPEPLPILSGTGYPQIHPPQPRDHQEAISKQVGTHSLVAARFALRWRSAQGRHEEVYHFPKLNVWRDLDLLPAALQQEILGRPQGYSGRAGFAPGTLVPPWTQHLLVQVRPQEFNRHWRKHLDIQPQLGRFYPRGMLENLDGIFRQDRHPARLVAMGPERFSFDLNHPLATYPLELEVDILGISPSLDEHGGRCTDILDELGQGPGMQARHAQQATDFFSGTPFSRLDEHPDQVFYSLPRLIDHLDRVALGEVSDLYGRLLPKGGRLLDLMSSVNSHLPASLAPASVTGLGLNEEELAANPVLSESLVQDLNHHPELPFPDRHFDAVVCTVSVEYLTRPQEVFAEVARVLRPGGVFVASFSNRWFPPKVVNIWPNLHEFERVGLVLEYFTQNGGFEALETYSVRGQMRPEDDHHIRYSLFSDPIYAVWGYRSRSEMNQ